MILLTTAGAALALLAPPAPARFMGLNAQARRPVTYEGVELSALARRTHYAIDATSLVPVYKADSRCDCARLTVGRRAAGQRCFCWITR